MRTSLLKPSKLLTGSLILLLVSVLSMNAYSYLSTQGEIGEKLAEAEKLKQEQTERTARADVFSDRTMSVIECTSYIILDTKNGQMWSAESLSQMESILQDIPEDAVIEVYENDGHKGVCFESGDGCSPSTCGKF